MLETYLSSCRKQFEYYKVLGEKTIQALADEDLFVSLGSNSNSIGIIVNHLWGNMLSRWTNFLNENGEKTWRTREEEFEEIIQDRKELMRKWEEGWTCLFEALDSITEEHFDKIVYIRNIGHTIPEAINRQLCHYAYHIGQIVFIGKGIQGEGWQSLSIPKGQSKQYNEKRFANPKRKGHFTDDLMK